MKLIKKIIIGALIALAGMFLLGAIVEPTPQDDREELCKQWMSDAAPGAERRMTRETCARLGVKL